MDAKVRNLLEKVKISASIIAGKTGRAATKAADVASKKANEVVESTKLNLQIFDLNTEIEMLYKEIGRIVYDTHMGIDTAEDELENRISLIDDKINSIEEIKAKLSEMKPITTCPNCGKECNRSDIFCGGCGAQL